MKAVSHKVLTFICDGDLIDILIAELSELGYHAFLVFDNGFEASIPDAEYDPDSINQRISSLGIKHSISISVKEIQERNWNIEWEKNYDPVVVENYCRIKASFHQREGSYPLEITINPKMSFGTGHHDTTYLMMKNQMGIDHKGKNVLDAGCGTGILSIFAEKLGAGSVTGFDTDQWAFENSIENIQINDCDKVNIFKGDVYHLAQPSEFDIILANINLNVILKDISRYAFLLKPGGTVILCGFQKDDYHQLHQCATKYHLSLFKKEARNAWLSLAYRKTSN